MSAVQVAPSGERSQGRGRYGVVCRANPVWSIPECLELKLHERRYTSTLYLFTFYFFNNLSSCILLCWCRYFPGKTWTIFSLLRWRHSVVWLYLSCRQGHTAACASGVSACIDDIIRWLASNRLMVNPAKTDILWCSTNKPPPDTPLSPSGTTVQPSSSLRNLGVLFESDLSLASHAIFYQ